MEKVPEELSQVRVVGLVVKAKGAAKVEVCGKLRWVSFTQDFNRSGHFLLADSLILLSLCGSLQTLPWQRAQVEVHEHIAKRLQVISSGLLYAQVGVDGSVASSASQVFVLAIRDVLVGASISVLLGQAKVNDVNKVALLPQAHKEVVGLDVSVDEVLGVYVLDTADHLVSQQKNSL